MRKRRRNQLVDLSAADTPHLLLWLFAAGTTVEDLRAAIGRLRIPALFPDPQTVPDWAKRFHGAVALVNSNWGEYEGPLGSECSWPAGAIDAPPGRTPKRSPAITIEQQARLDAFAALVRSLSAFGDVVFVLAEMMPSGGVRAGRSVDAATATAQEFLLRLEARVPVRVRPTAAAN